MSAESLFINMTKKKLSSQLIKTFANNVRLTRESLGISQEQLAELAELHRTYIGSVERGERNISLQNVERLARALKASPCDLICLKRGTEKR